MSTANTKISVVVIGKDEEKTLDRIFENFKELDRQVEGKSQLIYVDSNSTDGSLYIAKEFRKQNAELNVSIIKIQGNPNAAIARNVGIEHIDSQSKYIFFLDGDIIFDVEFVIKAISIMEKNERIASVCGTIMDSFETTDTKGMVRPAARAAKGNVVLWHGGNFVTGKSIIEQVGMFDDNLVKHQDIDYSFRMRNKGYILWMIEQRLGTHYTISYMNRRQMLNDLKGGKYISSGLLFKKYCVSKRYVDMLKSISGILFRCFVVCCAVLSIFFYPFGVIGVLGFVAVLSKTKTARGETVWSRALSFMSGIQFIIGLFKVRKKPIYEIQVI